MKLWILPLMLVSTNIFAQGMLSAMPALPDSTLTFKKDVFVGPKGAPMVDMFFVDGKLYNAQEFVAKSKNSELKDSHHFCLLTVNRDVLKENEIKKLSIGKQVTFGDKQNFGPKNLIIKDHLGNQLGVGNGFSGSGEFRPTNPNDNLERFSLIDEKGTLKNIYCFEKIWGFQETNAGWVSSMYDITIKNALGDYIDANILIDQNNNGIINQENRDHQKKFIPTIKTTPTPTVTEG